MTHLGLKLPHSPLSILPFSCYTLSMTITQTVEIPASHRLTIDVPREIPAGRTQVVIQFPVVEKQTGQRSPDRRSPDRRSDEPVPKSADEGATSHVDALKRILSQPTPRADALLGVAANLGDITLEQIREERLAKYLE